MTPKEGGPAVDDEGSLRVPETIAVPVVASIAVLHPGRHQKVLCAPRHHPLCSDGATLLGSRSGGSVVPPPPPPILGDGGYWAGKRIFWVNTNFSLLSTCWGVLDKERSAI